MRTICPYVGCETAVEVAREALDGQVRERANRGAGADGRGTAGPGHGFLSHDGAGDSRQGSHGGVQESVWQRRMVTVMSHASFLSGKGGFGPDAESIVAKRKS